MEGPGGWAPYYFARRAKATTATTSTGQRIGRGAVDLTPTSPRCPRMTLGQEQARSTKRAPNAWGTAAGRGQCSGNRRHNLYQACIAGLRKLPPHRARPCCSLQCACPGALELGSSSLANPASAGTGGQELGSIRSCKRCGSLERQKCPSCAARVSSSKDALASRQGHGQEKQHTMCAASQDGGIVATLDITSHVSAVSRRCPGRRRGLGALEKTSIQLGEDLPQNPG